MELVFIPTLAMGHLLSAVELAKRILHHDHRLSISVLLITNGPFYFSKITSFLESLSNDNPYPTRLTFLTLPPLSNPPKPSPTSFFDMMELYKPIVKQVVEDRLKARSSTLVGFVLDLFYTTMIDVGDELNVPSYIFFSSGANFLNLMFHVQSLADDQGIDLATEFNNPDAEFDVPGFKTRVSGKVIPILVVDNREAGSKALVKRTRGFRKSKGILINTFKELESFGVQALLELVTKGSIPPIYPVGPILELDDRARDGTHNSGAIEWLDGQPSSSVVFVCFGSMGTLDKDQVKELAKGLENSGQRFLWSLRKPIGEGKFAMPSDEAYVDALPEGFLDRTSERGKVIGWAPQVSVLAHRAMGGFVSHCGWNSVLESIWFGVPMAMWPFAAEQNLNAFLLMKEVGIAVEIRMDYQVDWMTRKPNFLVTCEDIEKGVNKLMNLDDEIKEKIREMSEKSRNTLVKGGTSYESLDWFIEDVLRNVIG